MPKSVAEPMRDAGSVTESIVERSAEPQAKLVSDRMIRAFALAGFGLDQIPADSSLYKSIKVGMETALLLPDETA